MTEKQMAELKERLEKLSKRKCWFDDPEFNAMDMSGGNFDDAYTGGFNDGEASLATEILLLLTKENP